MSLAWLARLFKRPVRALTPAQAQRLANWHALPEPDLDGPLESLRWVVVDVEASGLDMRHDRLISIGATSLLGATIILRDSFEVVLQQDHVSPTANILVHGIGGMAQRRGEPPVEALLAFLEFVGKSPLVAFHAAFDATMIGRALQRYLGLPFKRPLLDLADLAPALFPKDAQRQRPLDAWLTQFQIRNLARHNAVADALATAELMQVLLAQAPCAGMRNARQLFAAATAQVELSRMHSSAF